MKNFMLLCIFVMAGLSTGHTTDFNGVKFLMISAADKAAVVRNTEGELQLLRIGDMVDAETRIVAFEDNHVVLEGPGGWAPVKYIVEVQSGSMKVTQMARRPIAKYQFEGGEVKSFKTKSQ